MLCLTVPALLPSGVSARTDNGRDLLKLINKERKKARVAPLEWNEALAKFAKEYSAEMARENSISHTDRQGRTIEQRLKDAGITGIVNAGENLFVGSGGKNVGKTRSKCGYVRRRTNEICSTRTSRIRE